MDADRPTLALLMGCDGAGKTTWKRAAKDRRLPKHFYSPARFAGGIGDWNCPATRARARDEIAAFVAECLESRREFGYLAGFGGRSRSIAATTGKRRRLSRRWLLPWDGILGG